MEKDIIFYIVGKCDNLLEVGKIYKFKIVRKNYNLLFVRKTHKQKIS